MNYRSEYELQKVINALNQGEVEYMVFGNYAMKSYDAAKKVDALYVWVNPEKENLLKLDKALTDNEILHGRIEVDKIVEKSKKEPKRAESISFAINPDTGLKTVFTNTPYGLETTDFRKYYEKADTPAFTAFQNIGDKVKPNIVLNGTLKHKQLDADGLYANARIAVKYGQYSQNDQLLLQKSIEKKTNTPLNNTLDKIAFSNYKKATSVLDMESVLEEYGFNERADKTTKKWRVWEKDEIKIAVLNGIREGDNMKFGIDLSEALTSRQSNNYRGKVFDVVQLVDYLESGNLREKNSKLNQLMGDTTFINRSERQKEDRVMPVVKVEDLNDKVVANLRESHLKNEHEIKPISEKATLILKDRFIDEKTIHDSIFNNQLLSGTRSMKNNPDVKLEYVTFPISNESGQMVALLQRRKGNVKDETNPTVLKPVNEKLFSNGTRTAALWKSNLFYEVKDDIVNKDGVVIFPKDTVINVSKNPSGFMEGQQIGTNKIHTIPIEQKDKLKYVQANQIHLFEDALDAISYHQLVPSNEVRRMYLATSGHPSVKQAEHIKNVLGYNPTAQLVINTDNDPAGYRFGINHLNIKHPSMDLRYNVDVNITQQAPLDVSAMDEAKALEQSTDKRNLSKLYTNRLALSINAPFGEGHPYKNQKEAQKVIDDKINSLMKTVNGEIGSKEMAIEKTDLRQNKIGKIERNETLLNEDGNGIVVKVDVSLPNEKNFLRKAILGIKDLINSQQKQDMYRVDALKYEKDFNDLLTVRNGKPLEVSEYSKKPLPIQKLDVSQTIINERIERDRQFLEKEKQKTLSEKAGISGFKEAISTPKKRETEQVKVPTIQPKRVR